MPEEKLFPAIFTAFSIMLLEYMLYEFLKDFTEVKYPLLAAFLLNVSFGLISFTVYLAL